MPELPDVEGFRRTFATHAVGKPVRSISDADQSMTRNTNPRAVARGLKGRKFRDPARHGKLLVCPTAGPTLVLHFGMTGTLVWSPPDEGQRHPHDRLVLVFGDGRLRYRNMRKFGGIWLARTPQDLEDVVGRLGPDWLEVTRAQFDALLRGRRSAIKAALMDQKMAAGLGNLTADESLWQACIDPRRRVPDLRERDRDVLYRKIQKVLRDSLPYGLVPDKPTWLTRARATRPGACPRCGHTLKRTRIGGRTTVFCPREQK